MLTFHPTMSSDDIINTLNKNFYELEASVANLNGLSKIVVADGSLEGVNASLEIDLISIKLVAEALLSDSTKYELSVVPKFNCYLGVQCTVNGVAHTDVQDENQLSAKTRLFTTNKDTANKIDIIIKDITYGRIWDIKVFVGDDGRVALMWAKLIK